ncbi:MAG: RHS repeat protein [Candidatus Eremiobacteraeota bacterium]|nr:RHS repeat protein [Candidatus Eremiobacteraeota bacterium]
MSVQRQYYNETFSSSSNGTADFQTVIYASDQGVALASADGVDHDLVSGLTQDGTYFVTYVFTGGTVDAQNPGYVCEFRLVRSGSGSSLTVERRTTFSPTFQFEGSGSGSSVVLAPSMDVAVYCNAVASLSGGVDGMEAKIPGNWNVDRTVSGPTANSGPSTVRTFSMRLLALKNVQAEASQFDPKSDRNFTEIKGDVVALPAGWLPSGDILARLDVTAYGPIPVTAVEETLTLFGSPGAGGKVANFLIRWDGSIPGQDDPAEGLYQVQARIIAPTGIGTTKAFSKEVFVNAVSCSCDCDKKPTGNSKVSVPLKGLPESPVGPSCSVNLDYCTASSEKPPQSMGFGWQGKSTCRVFEPAGQSGALVYRSETGMHRRWNLQGSDYVPAFPDNYDEIVKNGSEPIYVVTFQDQSVREFNADGRLVRELDRNGNALEYTLDSLTGDLLSMTDASGQTVYFDYDGRTDGQPCYIRSLDPVTGREIELQYDANDRLEFVIQPGDGAPETTQFAYNAEGLLETYLLPSGLQPVVYVYDDFGRVNLEFYNITGTSPGYESVKEIYYDDLAHDLADAFGLNFDDQIVVATLITDVTASPSPGRIVFTTYDLLGNAIQRDELVYLADPLENSRFNTTIMEYNDSLNPHLMTRQIAPNGFTLTMTYNAQGNLASVHESYSDTTTEYRYTEDIDTPPFNPKWRNLLREIHRPTVTVNGSPVTYDPTVFTYDPTYGNLIEVEDAAGNSLSMQVSADGLVEQITDRRGHTTIFTYNNTTRRLESIETPGGPGLAPSRTTEFTYDDFLNLETVTAPTLPAAEFTYDGQNRPKRTTSPMGFYSESSYLNGLLTSMTLPSNQGSSSQRRETQFYYDLADRLEQVQAQLSSTPDFELRVGYIYDGLSQLKNLVRLKNSSLKATVYDYDFLGRMVRSEDFLVPGRETLIAYADYCTGNLTTTPRGVQREATYDERCRLRQLQTKDETHEFEYDELNRLISVRMGSRYAHGSPQVGAKYATGFYTHETRYTYDELDRVVEILYPNGETVHYEYNENGDVTRTVDVHGKETEYEYYHDGRLLSVTYEGRVFTYTYDAVGRLESLTYPTNPDDLVLNFSWDDDGRLLSMEYLKNNAAFQSFTYTYDDSGNRVTMVEVDPNSVTTNWEYGYDWFNRLTSVTKNSVLQESYTYDESDNRKTMTRHPVSELWEYSYDLADQLESITVTVGAGSPTTYETFTPDEDGNVLSRDKGGVVTEYQWDSMNRLRQVKVDGDVVMRSLYDAEGIRRLSKDDNGDQSRFFSSGGMSLADQRPGGPVSFMQGHQLLGLEQGGDFHFYITDGLGSVRLVVDETATVEGAFDHDVWGNPDNGVTPPGAELRAHSFIGGLGQRNDTASLGLYYARQRYYDPSLGRWLSADPIGFSGGLNLFTYVENNPTNLVDPSGLEGEEILLGFRKWVINTSVKQGPKCLPMALGEEASGALAGPMGIGAVLLYQVYRSTSTPRNSFSESRYVPNGPIQLRLPGFPGADTNYQRFVPNQYYRDACQQRVPRQSGPYSIRFRMNPDGTIKQATTYDQFGRRANQFDFGGRHGDEVHPFVYPPQFVNPEGWRTHPGIPLEQHGLQRP